MAGRSSCGERQLCRRTGEPIDGGGSPWGRARRATDCGARGEPSAAGRSPLSTFHPSKA